MWKQTRKYSSLFTKPSGIPINSLPKTAISKQKRNETSLKFGGVKKIYYLCTRKKDKIMNGLYTILLLVLSNIFMTLAWYGHLKLQQTGVSSNSRPFVAT